MALPGYGILWVWSWVAFSYTTYGFVETRGRRHQSVLNVAVHCAWSMNGALARLALFGMWSATALRVFEVVALV